MDKPTQPMIDIKITDEEIAEHAIVCWAALQEHEKRSFQLVANVAANHAAKQIVEWLERNRSYPDSTELYLTPEKWQSLKALIKE